MTLDELREAVRRRLREVAVSPAMFTEDDIDDAANDVYEEMTDYSEWNELTYTLTLLPGRPYYNLRHMIPSAEEFLGVTGIFNNQSERWLIPSDVRVLDYEYYRRWEGSPGEPDVWFMRGMWWLGLAPRTDAGGGTCLVMYSALAEVLEQDADTPGFPEEFHEAWADGVVGELLADDHEVRKSDLFVARYLSGLEALRRYVLGRISTDRAGRLGPFE